MACIFCFIALLFHPVHMGLINVVADKGQPGKIRIVAQYQAHDLSQATNGSDNIEESLQKKSIADLFARNFVMTHGTDTINYTLDSLTHDNALVMIFISFINNHCGFTITNNLLFDQFPEQKHLVIYNQGKNEKGLVFDYGNRNHTIKLEQ
ncbi:MAG: hypothetical protein HC896_04265 [Bacteroidales bacterium]|nr:hypothetical protein [Bacteroidales bacterium]